MDTGKSAVTKILLQKLLDTGGDDGTTWREANHKFLVPVHALSKLVRGKLRDMLNKQRPDLQTQLLYNVWNKPWVAWCEHRGQNETAVLDYLARYVHRIAITNRRIIAMDKHTVTFRYKDRINAKWRTCTLKGHEFMRRYLQHVLPKGFHKVRYYGLWHSSKRKQRQNARLTLQLTQTSESSIAKQNDTTDNNDNPDLETTTITCPSCGSNSTYKLARLSSRTRTANYSARASPKPQPTNTPV